MKRIAWALLCVWAAFALSGCASGPSLLAEGAAPDVSQGVLLTSVTATDGKHTKDTWFFFRKLGATDLTRLQATGVAFLIKPNDFSDHPSRKGRLLAMPLAPGDYELVTWTIYIQTFGGYGYISPNEPPPPIRFSVRPGRVTYLGAMHIETLTGKNIFGLEIPAAGLPEFGDNWAIDEALLRKKYPALASWPRDVSVPPRFAWVPRLAQGELPSTEKRLGPTMPPPAAR